MAHKRVLIFQSESKPEKSKAMEILENTLNDYKIGFSFFSEISLFFKHTTDIFIIENFDHDFLTNISTSRCNIYGPRVILHCIKEHIPLPKNTFPLFSMNFTSISICCTDIDKKERIHIAMMTRMYGGIYSKELTSAVTHLIAGKVGSKKYVAATKMKIPIVKSSWLINCLRDIEEKDSVDFITPLTQYLCGCFYGLKISVSGFSLDERAKIEGSVLDNDGVYSKNLICSETTHLIVGSSPGMKKVSAAKMYNIPCVTMEWFNNCIKFGCFVQESPYLFTASQNFISPALINKSRIEESIHQHKIEDTMNPFDFHIEADTKIFKNFRFYLSSQFDESKRLGLHAMVEYLGGFFILSPSDATHYITDYIDDKINTKLDGLLFVLSLWVMECYKNNKLEDEGNFLVDSIVDPPSTSSIPDPLDIIEKENNGNDNYTVDAFHRRLSMLKNDSFKADHREEIIPFDDTSNSNFDFDGLFGMFDSSHINKHQINTQYINSALGNCSSGNNKIQYENSDAFSNCEELMNKAVTVHNRSDNRSNINVIPSSNLKAKNHLEPAFPDQSLSNFNVSDIYIQLSAFDPTQKAKYSKVIQSLGARFIDNEIFDSKCTHLISAKMIRSEKILCALASGLWILKPSFLETSKLFGYFCNEESHEWQGDSSNLAKACKYWREYPSKSGKRVFSDWIVYLNIKLPKFNQFKQILECGGAKVIDGPFIDSMQFTHAIMDKNLKFNQNQLKKIRSITPNVYFPDFIITYLTNHDPDSYQRCIYTPSLFKSKK